MKKICMIAQSSYPYDPRIRRQAENLEKNGYEVDIICLPLGKQSKIEKYGNITAYRVTNKNNGQENIVKYVTLSLLFFFLAFFKLQRLYLKRKYSIIQIHNMPEFHIFIALIQKKLGVPLVLDIHDLTPELLTSKWKGLKAKILKPIVIYLERISCRIADHIITVTVGCKEILVKRGVPSDKISLILNTADTSFFKFNHDRKFEQINSNARILYHGTVAERFGLHIAIDAMVLILKEIPGAQLVVHGKYDSSYYSYLQEKIKKLDLQESVYLLGSKTHEHLAEIINSSDIEIVPYISNEYMNLSLSTKIFECAAAGLAVVATRLETLALSFDDSCILYAEDSSPKDFADKVVKLCKDPELRRRMVYNAHKALSSISGDIMAERYLRLIEKLMKVEPQLVETSPAKDLEETEVPRTTVKKQLING